MYGMRRVRKSLPCKYTAGNTYEKDNTAEIAVATASSLNGKSIEMYANELFNTWGIGNEDIDLLLSF